MASRIFWIVLAGVALVGGMIVQERSWLFGWGEEMRTERATEAAIEARVEQEVERSIEEMRVVGSDGRTIGVRPQTRHELGDAVRRLVAAETELALMRVRGGGETAVREARSRRDWARTEVERLKGEVERQQQLSERDRDLVREQIRQTVRETVRGAVGG